MHALSDAWRLTARRKTNRKMSLSEYGGNKIEREKQIKAVLILENRDFSRCARRVFRLDFKTNTQIKLKINPLLFVLSNDEECSKKKTTVFIYSWIEMVKFFPR